MNRRLFPLLVLMGLSFTASTRSEPAAKADLPKVSPRADQLDLLFVGSAKPERLELRVAIDGKSVPTIWDETFAKLFAFLDRDANGVLDKTEATRLPSAFALRQVLWGQFAAIAGDAPPFADLDLNADGKVEPDELADFYRRAGLGNVLVGVGKPNATEQLTAALLKYLDTSKDGKVEESEWKAAEATLGKLDKNDDELIGPGELVEKSAYPGALGSILLTAPLPESKPDSVTEALPFIVLPLRTADTHWIAATTTRREKAPPPKIEIDSRLRIEAPAAVWQIRLGARKKDQNPMEDPVGTPAAKDRLTFSTGSLRFALRADEGKLTEQTASARKRLLALFAECDANADKKLDEKELVSPKSGPFKQLLAIVDRDCDGQLDEKELTSWIELQEQVAKGHVLVTVLDHGSGLFEFLDADRDGSLSVRELRSAWVRLREGNLLTAQGFDRTKLPRHLLGAVSHGHPKLLLGKPTQGGPDWFLAMDRNGDGDVSRKEFLGSEEDFKRYDLDADGLLSPEEAKKIIGK